MATITCQHCDAEIFWDLETQVLKCQYCGHSFRPREIQNVEQVAMSEDVVAPSLWKDDDHITYKCNECGAEFTVVKNTLSHICEHCGHSVIVGRNVPGLFFPSLIIPLEISKSQAQYNMKKYLKNTKLLPHKFLKKSTINSIKATYIPFWLHTLTMNSSMDCDFVSREHAENALVDYQINLERVPACGDRKVKPADIEANEPFETDKLTKFYPGFLSGCEAYGYSIGEQESFEHVKKRVEGEMIDLALQSCTEIVTLYCVNNAEHRVRKHKVEYVFIPFWTIEVKYFGTLYRFFVNGSNGNVSGKKPFSLIKLILVSLFAGGCVFAALYFLGLLMLG